MFSLGRVPTRVLLNQPGLIPGKPRVYGILNVPGTLLHDSGIIAAVLRSTEYKVPGMTYGGCKVAKQCSSLPAWCR